MRELGPADPERLAQVPTVSRLTSLGAAAVLVPGVLVFVVGRLAGLGNGAAGLFGLLAMLVGMCLFPIYLRRLSRRFPS
jgi:hypothetical protein